MKHVKVLVVDDHALFRAGLISLLGEIPEVKVVGEADSGEVAIKLAANLKPDLILMDVHMPGMGGVRAVKALKQREDCRVLMLTISKNDADLFGAISAGADGYLLKNAEPDELRRAILQVSIGMSVLSPQVTRKVMQAVNTSPDRNSDPNLSSREMEVLGCLAQGKTTNQIAESLFISENTVKTHVRHILEKMEASNRAEAVSKAIQMGLIGTD
ncbi:MAG: response regulator transcription factor [Anaerolineales bacterium]|jgi:DNA-binding NarL/FixJ family response regulator